VLFISITGIDYSTGKLTSSLMSGTLVITIIIYGYLGVMTEASLLA